jgi:hypothetical protein
LGCADRLCRIRDQRAEAERGKVTAVVAQRHLPVSEVGGSGWRLRHTIEGFTHPENVAAGRAQNNCTMVHRPPFRASAAAEADRIGQQCIVVETTIGYCFCTSLVVLIHLMSV